jgi:phosphatidylglycerophosphatase C
LAESPGGVVIFDLDHTLVRCDSFAAFTRSLLLRRTGGEWWRTALVLVAAPVLLPLCVIPRTRRLAASFVVWAGSVGLDDAELEDLMRRHVRARFGKPGALVCRTALEALHQHRARGDRVLVVTGADAELARLVCEGIGVPGADVVHSGSGTRESGPGSRFPAASSEPGVEIVGSSLRRAYGGWVVGEHCHGPHKVRMLARMGIAGADCVYTDSARDLPLLRLGIRRVLVNATVRHRKQVASALGGTFEAVTWS